MSKPYIRLDRDNAAVLLVDHQAGLMSLVRDIEPDRFKNNVLALADSAKYFNLPTILTTSFENGPNGPLMPELKEMFPDEFREETFKAPPVAEPYLKFVEKRELPVALENANDVPVAFTNC